MASEMRLVMGSSASLGTAAAGGHSAGHNAAVGLSLLEETTMNVELFRSDANNQRMLITAIRRTGVTRLGATTNWWLSEEVQPGWFQR